MSEEIEGFGFDKKQKKNKDIVTEQAIKISKRLKLSWPGLEHKKELIFIQLNLNYLTSLRQRIPKLLNQLKDEAAAKDKQLGLYSPHNWRQANLVGRIWQFLNTPEEITSRWTEQVNEIANTSSKWNGNLLKWVLKDKHPHIEKIMCEIICDYTGSGAAWSGIRKKLYTTTL